MLTGLDIEAKAALVRDQLEAALAAGKSRPADVSWEPRPHRPRRRRRPRRRPAPCCASSCATRDQNAVGPRAQRGRRRAGAGQLPRLPRHRRRPGRARPTGCSRPPTSPQGRRRRTSAVLPTDAREVPGTPRPTDTARSSSRSPEAGPARSRCPPGPTAPRAPRHCRRRPQRRQGRQRQRRRLGRARDDAWRWLAHTLTVDRFRELLPETGRPARHPARPARPARPQLRRRRAPRRGRRLAGPLRPAGQGPRRMAALPPPGHPGGAACDRPALPALDPRRPRTTPPTARPCSRKLADLDAEHAKALAGGGEKYVDRHRERGKLLARERIELLLDPDTPVPGAVAAGRLGQRLPGRRLPRHRHRRGRGRRVPDHRQRPDRARRRQQPVDAEEGPAGQRDRPREPAAAASASSSPAAPTCPPRRRSSSPAARSSATSPGCRPPGSRRSPSSSATPPPAARTSPACPTT